MYNYEVNVLSLEFGKFAVVSVHLFLDRDVFLPDRRDNTERFADPGPPDEHLGAVGVRGHEGALGDGNGVVQNVGLTGHGVAHQASALTCGGKQTYIN